MFEHSLILGLLATEDYSRAVLSRHVGVTAEQVTARVAALSRCVGSPQIMRDALAHLAAMARRPNITVQVLADAGAHVAPQGAFTVAEVTGAACSVNKEDITEGRVCDDAATIVAVSVRFRWLQAEAMPTAASQAFMERMAEQWTQAAPGGARRLTPVPAAASASK